MSNSKTKELIYRKCRAKDCKKKIEEPYLFCSIECAIYSNALKKNGWDSEVIKKYMRGK